jgi:hypothetical protein
MKPKTDRREHPRTPGKFKEAEDAAYKVMREVEIVILPEPSKLPKRS